MIKKVWAKFDGMDIDCICDYHHRKCKRDDNCKPYVVKFIDITEEEEQKDKLAEFDRKSKKFERELNKTIKKMEKFKL